MRFVSHFSIFETYSMTGEKARQTLLPRRAAGIERHDIASSSIKKQVVRVILLENAMIPLKLA